MIAAKQEPRRKSKAAKKSLPTWGNKNSNQVADLKTTISDLASRPLPTPATP